MYKICIALLFCCLPAMVQGQENQTEVERLRKELDLQRQQIDELKSKLERQQQLLERISGTTPAPADMERAKQGKALAASNITSAVKPEKSPDAISPLSFRIGGADFTPGGFLDMSTVWRSTNVGSGVATAFGSIPANNSLAGNTSEWRFSAYNSRISLKVTERPLENRDVLATGYFETDFAGAMPATTHVTGNSLSFRMRQAWLSVQAGKFEIMGGQAWSLMTPNRSGTSAAPSDVFLGLGQDSAYLAGLVWARQAQIRATYRPQTHWTFAFSVENPQQYVTSGTTLPAGYASQFDSNTGNTTIANPRPDLVAKIAYDTKIGNRGVHLEIAGLSRQFRTLRADNVQHSAQGLGGSVNLIIEPVRNFRWILTSFYSSGGGRYIMGLGPDVVVGPDGSLSPIHSASGIAGFEYQISRPSQIFGYYSGTYFSRNYMTVSPGNYLGYGYPGSPASANRQIQEATVGYSRTFWKNPNFGAFQALGQYSYLTRSPWYAASPKDEDMHTHMIYTGMRFTLP